MFYLKFAVLLVLGQCLGQTLNRKFCDSRLCGDRIHIACNNDGKFSPACSRFAKVVPFLPQHKRFVIDFHNEIRERVASGQMGLPKAARMLTMKWSPTLAFFALLNVKQCKLQLDACRNTAKLRYVGQSVAQLKSSKPINAAAFLKEQFSAWAGQSINIKPQIIDSYKNGLGSNYAQFSQMIRDGSSKIGCAMLQDRSDRLYTLFLACNYALANIVDDPVYETGPPTTKCTSGGNKDYMHLCSKNESLVPPIQPTFIGGTANDYSDELYKADKMNY